MGVTAEALPTLFDDAKKRFSDFALRDYESKVAYLINQLSAHVDAFQLLRRDRGGADRRQDDFRR